VHDSVTDRGHAGLGLEELPKFVVVDAAVPRVYVQRGGDVVDRAEHAELEAA